MNSFWYGGDAAQLSGLLDARAPMKGSPVPRWRSYFDKIDTHQQMISPAEFPDTLVGYPPTITVTGTRDVAMSNALITHTRLLTAGVGRAICAGRPRARSLHADARHTRGGNCPRRYVAFF